MNDRLKDLTGVTLTSESGNKYRIEEQIGSGAQGVVYKESSSKYVVKLYYPSHNAGMDDDIVDRLRFIKDVVMPKNFVTIVDLITKPYVGYVMDKVTEHKPLNSYLIPDRDKPFH